MRKTHAHTKLCIQFSIAEFSNIGNISIFDNALLVLPEWLINDDIWLRWHDIINVCNHESAYLSVYLCVYAFHIWIRFARCHGNSVIHPPTLRIVTQWDAGHSEPQLFSSFLPLNESRFTGEELCMWMWSIFFYFLYMDREVDVAWRLIKPNLLALTYGLVTGENKNWCGSNNLLSRKWLILKSNPSVANALWPCVPASKVINIKLKKKIWTGFCTVSIYFQ